MTLTLRYEPRFRSLGWLWSVALFLPFLLGAGLLEESPHGPVLPLTESYRTPLSKTIYGDAADWRASTSQEEEMDWRKPKDSENDWRTKSRQATPGPLHPGHVRVLPNYQAEKDIVYDYSHKRAPDHIKILQFNF